MQNIMHLVSDPRFQNQRGRDSVAGRVVLPCDRSQAGGIALAGCEMGKVEEIHHFAPAW